ncbi:MAG: TolC family protein [Verrucomicrobiales bacterium]|jgi:cobalt-zinc-cadmium efflux system outer membrane protein|nr:TolC family protein [Verrucomicrobiae bacterium]MCC7373782.1 TolC family protein [Verrucomicrobiales bacterium]
MLSIPLSVAPIFCGAGRGAAILLVLNLMAHQAIASTNTPPTELASATLEAVVDEALAKNPELRFYEAEIAAATAGRRTAGAWRNPELTGTIGHKTADGGGLSAEGVAWSVSVLQPFEWPGRIGLRKAIANQDVELANLGLARFKTALAGRVRALAFSLFAAEEKSAAASEVADRFKALREVLVQRDPAGLTPLLEIRVIEATELNAQRKASEALLVTQSALLELNQLRGAPPQISLKIADSSLAFRPPEDRDELLAMARTNNFELKVRAVELAQQGFRVDLARNERYPAVALGPTFAEENAGSDRERILGVVVSLPLPFWNRNRGNVEAASARQTQAAVSYELAQRDVTRRVLETALTYETKLREMAKWRPDSVAHFREAAEVADRHYRLGAVPISTYVELQKQYLDAVEGLLDTKREALEAAVQLELLTGVSMPLSRATPRKEGK